VRRATAVAGRDLRCGPGRDPGVRRSQDAAYRRLQDPDRLLLTFIAACIAVAVVASLRATRERVESLR